MILLQNKIQMRLLTIVGLILVILPIVVYYDTVNTFAINIPVWDEYDQALLWIQIVTSTPFPENLLHLFNQANEHRIFSYFATILAQYKIWGELNFRHIILFGNLGMIGLLFVLYKLKHNDRNSLLTFSPVVLLLFAPQQEITNWGILTMNGVFEYLLVFLSLYFLDKKGKLNFVVAVLLAAMATFSFGNGLFVFFAGLTLLFLKQPRSFLHIFLWAFFMVGCISLYLVDYNPSISPYSKFEIFDQPISGLLYFMTLFGRLFSVLLNRNLILYYVVGLAVISFFCYLVLNNWKYHKKNPLAFAYLVFLLFSALAITISRVGYGVEAATAPRYILLPILFVSVMYISCINIHQGINHRILVLTIMVSLILYGGRLLSNVHHMNVKKANLSFGLLSYYANPDSSKLNFPRPQVAAQRMKNAISAGFYTPPTISELFPDIRLKTDLDVVAPSDNIHFCIDQIIDNEMFVQLTGWAFMKEGSSNRQKTGIVLKSESDVFLFSTVNIMRKDVPIHFSEVYPDIINHCGFLFVLEKAAHPIPSGRYQVGIYVEEKGGMKSMRFTNQFVRLKSTSVD
ncbi:MAG: hypothetical protein CVT99_00250 [Bacteroidetes bacterium HGW-Bacteroidetes-16]|nr:MAG: hypothetical protein CVT99_00250 [Bacteroidetes bacterium HGW-Bacteroidetes-16]